MDGNVSLGPFGGSVEFDPGRGIEVGFNAAISVGSYAWVQ